jgi:hypothetical protein
MTKPKLLGRLHDGRPVYSNSGREMIAALELGHGIHYSGDADRFATAGAERAAIDDHYRDDPGPAEPSFNGEEPAYDDWVPPEEAQPTSVDLHTVDGAAFILDEPLDAPAHWGTGTAVLWPEGEALMIAGPQGLCKTTLAGLLVRAQLGLGDGMVLSLPVSPIDGPILYLAMDRPRQIARSLRRQFTEADRAVLTDRLIVRRGPPPADLASQPLLLAGLAAEHKAAVVYIDSLKDAAIGLSKDEVAAAYNRARQHLLAQGCELCELHHTVKRGQDGGPPKGIADIYGSAWLTNGCGSVILLSGDPGDPIIGFRHAKQPSDEVGPWQLLNDPAAGALTVEPEVDLLDLVRAKGVDGLTARDAAAALSDTSKPPTRAQKENARRRLVKLEAASVLVSVDHDGVTAWFLAERGCTGVHEK